MFNPNLNNNNNNKNNSVSSFTTNLIHLVSKIYQVGIYSPLAKAKRNIGKINNKKLSQKVTNLKIKRQIKEREVSLVSSSSLTHFYSLTNLSLKFKRTKMLQLSKFFNSIKRLKKGTLLRKQKVLTRKEKKDRINNFLCHFRERYSKLRFFKLSQQRETKIANKKIFSLFRKQMFIKNYKQALIQYRKNLYKQTKPLFLLKLLKSSIIRPTAILLVKDSLILSEELKNKIKSVSYYTKPNTFLKWKPVIQWLAGNIKTENSVPNFLINFNKNAFKKAQIKAKNNLISKGSNLTNKLNKLNKIQNFNKKENNNNLSGLLQKNTLFNTAKYLDFNYFYLQNKYSYLKEMRRITEAFPKIQSLRIANSNRTPSSIFNLTVGNPYYPIKFNIYQPFLSYKPLGVWNLNIPKENLKTDVVDLYLKISSDIFNAIYKNFKVKNCQSNKIQSNKLKFNIKNSSINPKIYSLNSLKTLNGETISTTDLILLKSRNPEAYKEFKQIQKVYNKLQFNPQDLSTTKRMELAKIKMEHILTANNIKELQTPQAKEINLNKNILKLKKSKNINSNKKNNYFNNFNNNLNNKFKNKKKNIKLVPLQQASDILIKFKNLKTQINKIRKLKNTFYTLQYLKMIDSIKGPKRRISLYQRNLLLLKKKFYKFCSNHLKQNTNTNSNTNTNTNTLVYNLSSLNPMKNKLKYKYSNLRISLNKMKFKIFKLTKNQQKAKVKKNNLKVLNNINSSSFNNNLGSLIIPNFRKMRIKFKSYKYKLIYGGFTYEFKKRNRKKQRIMNLPAYFHLKEFRTIKLLNKQNIRFNSNNFMIKPAIVKILPFKVKNQISIIQKKYPYFDILNFNPFSDKFNNNLNHLFKPINLNNNNINIVQLLAKPFYKLKGKELKIFKLIEFKGLNSNILFNQAFLNHPEFSKFKMIAKRHSLETQNTLFANIFNNLNSLKNSQFGIKNRLSNILFNAYFKQAELNFVNFKNSEFMFEKLAFLHNSLAKNALLPQISKLLLKTKNFQRNILANEILILKALCLKIEKQKKMNDYLINVKILETQKLKEEKENLIKKYSTNIITKFNNTYKPTNSKYIYQLSEIYSKINNLKIEQKLNKTGISMNYNKFISYNFIKYSNGGGYISDRLFKNINTLLISFFKTIYCLISKPVFIITPDKVIIKLFYFICLPNMVTAKFFRKLFIKQFLLKNNLFKFLEFDLEKNFRGFNKLKTQKHAFIFATHKKIKNKIKNRLASYFNYNSKSLLELNSSQMNSKPYFSNLNNFNSPYPKFKTLRLIKKIRNTIDLIKRKKKSKFFFANVALASKINIAKAFPNKFKNFSALLSKLFNKTVEFELTRLHKPNLDSTILVTLLSLMVNKKKRYKFLVNNIYAKTNLVPFNPHLIANAKARRKSIAFLSGLNITAAGRLRGERVIPKITTQTRIKGISAPGKVNFLDVAKLTKKNRKGAFTITVTTGQNLF
nr:ribosomal protein S3 [Cyathus striatus]